MRRRGFLRAASVSVGSLATGCLASTGPEADATPAPTCPALLEADLTVCPGGDGGPLAIERAGATVSTDRWSIRITIENVASSAYRFAPDDWSLHRWVSSGWTPVVTSPDGRPWKVLAPGERYAWGIAPDRPAPAAVDLRITIPLDPGHYVLTMPFQGPERVATIAPFKVDD